MRWAGMEQGTVKVVMSGKSVMNDKQRGRVRNRVPALLAGCAFFVGGVASPLGVPAARAAMAAAPAPVAGVIKPTGPEQRIPALVGLVPQVKPAVGSAEPTSELQSPHELVCRLPLRTHQTLTTR